MGRTVVAEPEGGTPYLDRMNLLFTPVRGARFGALARRRRRGALGVLFALIVLLVLTWGLPTMGSALTSVSSPLLDSRKAEESSGGSPGGAAAQDEEATQNRPPGAETPGDGPPARKGLTR